MNSLTANDANIREWNEFILFAHIRVIRGFNF